MNTNILNTIILGTSFIALFGIAELLYHKLKIKIEVTRKLVHTGSGLIALLFPIMLSSHWYVLFLSSSFVVILALSTKYKMLQSINAIERQSVGSLAFPVAIYICFAASSFCKNNLLFYLPILILAICDPLAALVGKRWPLGKYSTTKESKTVMGSGAFFTSAVLLSSAILFFVPNNINHYFLIAILIGITATVAEALSKNGYDNIAVPIVVLLTYLIIQ